jgi:FkbM family methyltransferase
VGARLVTRYVLRYLEARDACIFRRINGISLIQYPDAMSEKLLDGKLWRLKDFNSALAVLDDLKNKIFIDVGANVGMHSIYAARKNIFTKILAIEPLKTNFELLCANLRLNSIDNVVPMQCALSDSNSQLPLYIDRMNFGASGFHGSGGEFQFVPIRRMDDLLGDLGMVASSIGLIWMNVRGHEKQALDGMTGLLARRVPLVIVFSPHAEADSAINLLQTHYHHFAWKKSEGPKPIASLTLEIFRDRSRWLAFW